MTNDDKDFEDPEVAALLRGHAERLTGPIDVDGALRGVQQRGRVRRRWRAVGSVLTAAAAAAAIVVTASVLIADDRPTVRTPAAQTAAPSTATAITPPPSSAPSTSPPSTSGPTSTDSTSPTSSTAATTTPPTGGSSPTTPATDGTPATQPSATTVPTTSTFTSAGGSIVVTLSNGAVSLTEDPSPSTGWSYRIDDNGPSRVRVRFERDDERSEIRVDLQGGELVPEITED